MDRKLERAVERLVALHGTPAVIFALAEVLADLASHERAHDLDGSEYQAYSNKLHALLSQ